MGQIIKSDKHIAGLRGQFRRFCFAAITLLVLGRSLGVQGQTTQPLVAIHDSEWTRSLETQPAVSPTPTNAGTTGFQWWTTDWHYFVMPASVEEAFRSDGTAFTVIGDSNISANALLTNGVPAFPIVITLASEAMSDDEIAPLTNYVAAGGFLFIGGSSFTRNTNGVSRGDFALATQMGVHMITPAVTNWTTNNTLTRQFNHRLVTDIPDGQLTWRMPSSSDEINWGISPSHVFLAPHDLWQVQVADATLVAQADIYPYITVRPYGKGYIIYDAAFEPLIGNGGFAPGMYAYSILRRAVEWAFESAKLPVPKLSPWPYQYNAAFMIRHDLEDFTNEIADLELSAQVEYSNGVRGDYYFCTGTLRQDMSGYYNTNNVVLSLQQAITSYGATIGPHNGGLPNPNNPGLVETNYDFWHWGPDEALSVTPLNTNYATGVAYATASVSNSFKDIESWLPGLMTTNMRVWAAPNFNATREGSYQLQQQLGVKIAGDQKLTPFPHWTLSSQTSGLRYNILSEPVSDWFVGGLVAQSMEPWHPPGVHTTATVEAGVDFYYSLGALVNFYSHTLSTGEGAAGQLVPEYISYSMNTNLHPRLWSANAISVYQWWLQRSNAQVSVSSAVTNGNQCATTFVIAGSASANTSVEMVLPAVGTVYGVQVYTNGTLAGGNSYRTAGQTLKVIVGTSVTNAVVTYSYGAGAQSDYYNLNTGTTLTIAAPGVLANDTGGLGSTGLQAQLVTDVANGTLNLNADGSFTYTPAASFIGMDSFTYQAYDGQTSSAATTVTIEVMPSGDVFYDDFSRSAGADPLAPWQVAMGNWAITNGTLQGTSALQSYGFAFVTNNFTAGSIQASVQFPAGAFGGGIGGRLNPVSGAQYTAWIYPESVPGGAATLDLIKFIGWGNWSGTPMQRVSIPGGVGTNWHALTMAFSGSQISVGVDGTQLISLTDTNFGGLAPYASGSFCADMYAGTNSYTMSFDNVSVTSGNPVAASDSYAMAENTTLIVPAPGILTNDTGITGSLSAVLISGPANGTLTLGTNGGFTYVPAPNFVGTDGFTYEAFDGQTNSSAATVSINVYFAAQPPVAVNDLYTFDVNVPLAIAAPGVLENDTDPNGETLTAMLVSGPTNGTLTLNPDGSFIYVPATNFGGTDSFTYQAYDAQTNSGIATVTLTDPASGILFADNFMGTNAVLSPFIVYSNNWTVTNGMLEGGVNPLSTYAFVYLTNSWTNYAVEGRIQFSTNSAFGGGIGGCLNPATGAHYAAWVYPENSPDGPAIMNIVKFHSWNSWGYNGVPFTPLATATNLPGGVGTNWHKIKIAFSTNRISAYYDGTEVISMTDTEAPPFLSGGITVDMWTDLVPYVFSVSNIVVSPLVLDDSYNVNANSSLTIPAPGVLGNDTEVYGTNLQAVLLNNPTNGVVSLSTNGGFIYTPISNYVGLDSFVYAAIDGQTNLGTATAIITVNGTHNGPSLPGQTNITNIDETPITVTNTASDSDVPVLTLTYSLLSAPSGATISSNGIITWTPTPAQSPSTNVFTTLVTDSAPSPKSASNSFTVYINEVNIAPVLPTQTNRTINELTLLTVTNTATEPDSNAVITGYALLGAQPGMSIDTNGIFTWTPSQTQSPSTNTVTVVVANNDPLDQVNPVLTSTIFFKVFVKEVNVAPVPTAISNQTVGELTLLTVTNTVTEPNIHAVTTGYRLINPLTGMTINSNGVFTWTPAQNQSPGSYLVTVVVTNNDSFDLVNPILTATNTFNVLVKEINVAPVLPTNGTQTVNELALLTVTETATEPNIHAVTTGYSLISPLSGMSISTNGIFTWTPSQSQSPGSNTVTVVVTNSDTFDTVNPILTATNTFTVLVKEINVAPVLPTNATQTVNEQILLTVTNTATEPNIHAVTTGYNLVSPLAGMSISTNGIFTWTPAQTQSPGTNLITVVVTNNDAFDLVNPVLAATNTFSVIVKEINIAPLLASPGAQTVNEQTLLTVTNLVTEPNIHAVTTGFGLINPLAGMNINSNGVFTWTPSQSQSPSVNTVTVVATNKDAFDTVNPILTATNTFTVTVKEINIAPVLPTNGTQTVNEQTLLTVTNTATEPNIHATTTGYTLVSPLAGMSINTNGIFTWTPGQSVSPSTNLVTLIVTNNDAFDLVNPNLMATNSFTVIVKEVNVAPVVSNIVAQTVNELTLLTVTNFVTEPNIHAVTTGFGLYNPLPGMSVNTNGVFTWTPSQTQSPGTNQINVVVTNNDPLDLVNPILTTTNTFTVFVKEINVAPILAAAGTQTVNEQTLLTVTNIVTEPNIHAVTAGFGLISPLAGMSINSNGIFAWTPAQTQSPSTNLVTVVITNNDAFDLVNPNLTATNSFTVIVKEVNIAPVLPTNGTQTVNELTLLTVTNTATEPNIHAVTDGYALINPVSGMNIDTNGIFTWTPAQNQSPSTNTVTVVVVNKDPFDPINTELTAVNSFTVIVREVNVAPVVSNIVAQTVNELTLLTVTNFVTEPNIHAVTTGFGLYNPLPGMSVNTNGVFTWTPSQTQSPGTNQINVVVTNNDPLDLVNPILTTTNTFTVFVKEINVAPILAAAGTQTVNEQTLLTVTNIVTEPNIHAVTAGFGLISPLAGMSINSNGIFAWTPAQIQSPSTNLVTVVITNNDAFDLVNPNLTATNSFTVIVKEANIAPVLPTNGTQTVNELTLLTVTNTATEPNIHAATTGYGLINPLSGMSISTNGIFTWTPGQSQSPGTNTVTVVVTNSDTYDTVNPVLTATNAFSVIVKEINIAPVLPVISTQTVSEQTLLTVTNTATEPNIHAVTTGYALVGALTGMNIDTNGIFTWTPSQGQSPGTSTVTVVATNSDTYDTVNSVLTVTNSFTVIVKEINIAPVLPVVSTQTVNEQTLLTVTNTATEPNIHAVTTGYSLISPLTGMSISTNGIFTWTPSQSQSPGTNTITVVATNSDTYDTVNSVLTATNNFTVIVKEINIAPVLPVISTQTVNEQTLLTVTNTATEPDIHAVTTGYSLISPLTGMSISTNGIFTWTPSQSQSPSTNTVTVMVTNNDSFDSVNPALTATNSFTVIVKEINIAPVLPVVSTQTVNEQTLLTVTNTATEPNIHAVTTGYSLVNPLAGMNIDTNGIFTWTPSQSQSPGTSTVTVVATNSDLFDTVNPVLTATNTFTVTVKEVNVAPILVAAGTQTVNEQTLLTVTNMVTEPNIHAVTAGFGLVSPLAGMSINSNGVFTWTPAQNQSPGTNLVTVMVTNNDAFDLVNPNLTATNSFTVIVREVNLAPVLPVVSTQTVNEQTLLTVTNTATEPNIHAVTTGYSLVNPLAGMNINTNGIFTWTPSQSRSPGTSTVTIVATNSDTFDTVNPVLTATNTFTVVVKEINIAPVLPVISTQTVNEQTLLTVTNTATEPNIHAVTTGYALVGALAGMNIDTNGIFTWTPSQNQSPGTNTITVVATNSDTFDTVNPVLTTTNTFTVIVKEINIAPVLPVVSTQTVNEQTLLTVTNTATEPNIHAITTGYSLVNPLAGMNIDTNGIFTWTPVQTQSPGTNTITVVAANSDPSDTVNPILTTTNTFTVIVKEVNIAPVLGVIGNQTVTLSSLLTVTNIATEPNIHAVTAGYGLVNAPAGASISAVGIITWTPTSPGTNTITTVVTNYDSYDLVNPALTATNSFTVVATGSSSNQPPAILSIASTNGVITITWSSTVGKMYEVQYKNDWAATNWQQLGTNILATNTTSTATDTNGNPQRFYRVVQLAASNYPAPVIQSIALLGGNIVVTWTAISNATYEVLYKTNLTSSNWVGIIPNVTAGGSTASITNVMGTSPQQFYRVLVVP